MAAQLVIGWTEIVTAVLVAVSTIVVAVLQTRNRQSLGRIETQVGVDRSAVPSAESRLTLDQQIRGVADELAEHRDANRQQHADLAEKIVGQNSRINDVATALHDHRIWEEDVKYPATEDRLRTLESKLAKFQPKQEES